MTRQDVANADNILGPRQALLQEKPTRKRPDPVAHTLVHIPPEVFDRIHSVIVVGDVFFVNSIPFLMTKAHKIRFTTVQHCPKLDIDRIFELFK